MGDLVRVPTTADQWCAGQAVLQYGPKNAWSYVVIFEPEYGTKDVPSAGDILSSGAVLLVPVLTTIYPAHRWSTLANAKPIALAHWPRFKIGDGRSFQMTDHLGNILGPVSGDEAARLNFRSNPSFALVEHMAGALHGHGPWRAEYYDTYRYARD